MKIKGFIDFSLVDWDGKVSCVIFLPGCNLRCPYCYNAPLVLHPDTLRTIPFEEIESYLRKNRGWIDGVVISGGEPSIHNDLPELCSKIKSLGFLVKLDTNGSNPAMIKELIDRGLVDYVAMDVKAPLAEEAYSKATGVDAGNLLEKIRQTIKILQESNLPHEFRTTVIPTLHSKKDVEEIAQAVKECKKYVLQNFMPVETTINPKFKEMKTFTEHEMYTFLEAARRTAPNTILRGYVSHA